MQKLNILNFRSDFAKNFLILFTGTSFSQIIPIAISPVLTRIYSPSDFGQFAVYLAIVTILSIIATGRYEISIVLPKKDIDAINILFLSIFISLIFSVFIFVVILLFGTEIILYSDRQELKYLMFLIPPSFFLLSLYNSINYWFNRKKDFRTLANNRIILAVIMAITQLLIGYLLHDSKGLIIGFLIAQFIAVVFFIKKIISTYGSEFKNNLSLNLVTANARQYSNFPKYSLASDLLNTLTNQMPVLLFTSLFSSSISGFYALTTRILNTPSKFIAKAMMDVFKQRASEDYNSKGNCLDIFSKTLRVLILISIVPFTVVGLFGQQIFVIIFGGEWATAGLFVQILAPFFFLRFVISPLSYVFYISNKQKYDLFWQGSLFLLTIFSIYFGYSLNNYIYSVISFSVSYSFLYLINLAMSYNFSKGR